MLISQEIWRSRLRLSKQVKEIVMQKHLFLKLLSVTLLVFVLSACATLDEGECETANWYELGVKDGERGRKEGTYTNYRKDCSEYNIDVNVEEYRTGWQNGIVSYCDADNAFRIGVDGNTASNYCPLDLRDSFASAHSLGFAIHSHRSRIDEINYRQEEIIKELVEEELTQEEKGDLANERADLKDELIDEEQRLVEAIREAEYQGYDNIAY